MTPKLRVLDLCSGIGGYSLGLERTGGFETIAFCEADEFCREVLRKHWTETPVYEDVRSLTYDRLRADGLGAIDVICGGWPCQDLSVAGKRAGIDGERSGLWREFARLIGVIRPRWTLLENVANLLSGDHGKWMGRVLGDLAEIGGYDVEWHCIPASAVGAPHRRDRVWIVANANGFGCGAFGTGQIQGKPSDSSSAASQQSTLMAHAECQGLYQGHLDQTGPIARCGEFIGAHREAEPGVGGIAHGISTRMDGDRTVIHDIGTASPNPWQGDWEMNTPRVAHGVPDRADRLRALGNALVPQIPELIGHAILRAEANCKWRALTRS